MHCILIQLLLCKKLYQTNFKTFRIRIKEHLPACVLKFIEESGIKTTATKNAAKTFSIAEHLINKRGCARYVDLK